MMKIKNNKEYIFAFGPNPAWQKTLFFKNFLKGEINRADKRVSFPAGKGINFCKAATSAGADCLLFQFAGGHTGDLLCDALDDHSFPHVTVKPDSLLRTCTTCLCQSSSRMTELIEPAGAVTAADVRELLEQFIELLSICRGVALCGTIPPGGDDLYLKVVEIARANSLPVIYDAWQDTGKILECGVDIFKVNRDELKSITGEEDVISGIKYILGNYNVKVVAITDGPEVAYLGYDDKIFIYSLPMLDKVINPLGCGDTASGIMFSRYLEGESPENAFAAALAAASANCLTEKCAEFDLGVAASIQRKIELEEYSE